MNSTATRTVAILGNGVVGIALAKGFAGLGYEVIFGTRDPDGAKSRDAIAAVPGARAASFADAAKAANVAVTALPWSGLAQALAAAGADNLAGKLVIDPTNPLEMGPNGPRLAIGHTDSAGETVQRLLPQSKVVKAFNIITAGHMVHPQFADGQPDMFTAGDDADAKMTVAQLLHDLGWRAPIDMGDITASRLLEPLAMIWIHYGVTRNHWTHGFSLLNQKA